MSYIGNSPTSVAFLTDYFSGNGSTTAFTMSVAPNTSSAVLVSISGVLQDPSAYSVVGTTLTFSAAPPTGSSNIVARYMGIPASGVTSTAYRTVTEYTATSGQTTFSPPSYTPGYINVYRNGVRLGAADYTASNGTTVVLVANAVAGDLITLESFYVSSVLNALPSTGGTINAVSGATPLIVQANGTTALTVDSGAGVTAAVQLNVQNNSTNSTYLTVNNTATNGRSYSIYSSGGGPSTAGTFGIYDNGVGGGNRLQITSAGVVNLPLGQLSFPATQNASSDANTLDDYEEGSWTPVWYGQVSNPTYTLGSTAARYVKIGRLVYFNLSIQWSGKSGGSSTLGISLPFPVANISGYWTGSASVGYCSGLSFPVSGTYTDPGQINMFFRKFDTTGSLLTTADMGAAGHVMLGGCYLVD